MLLDATFSTVGRNANQLRWTTGGIGELAVALQSHPDRYLALRRVILVWFTEKREGVMGERNEGSRWLSRCEAYAFPYYPSSGIRVSHRR